MAAKPRLARRNEGYHFYSYEMILLLPLLR
jgi:hypothetical protein